MWAQLVDVHPPAHRPAGTLAGQRTGVPARVLHRRAGARALAHQRAGARPARQPNIRRLRMSDPLVRLNIRP